jgi:hypothetical protein
MNILKYNTELESNELIGQINLCLGLPTPNGGTTTWAYPMNYCYSGGTEYGWTVVITDQCIDCLTESQKLDIIELPNDLMICSLVEGYNP